MALVKQVRPDSTGVTHGSQLLSDVLNGLTNTKYLNIAALRAVAPAAAGQTVEVLSAASATDTELHYGGGTFEAVAKTGTDDGGINIIPSTGTLMWKRINYDMPELVFWGVKPDVVVDNAAAITKAMTYLRSIKGTIKFPGGAVYSSQGLPLWSECSIVGQGRELSKFIKTSNTPYAVASGVNVDALLLCLPDTYNPTGPSVDTFCVRPNVRSIRLERQGVTAANKSMYGIWGHKIAQGSFEDMLVLGAQYGFYGRNVFLMRQSHVSYSGVVGSYAGVYIVNDDGGQYNRTGTTCNFFQVGVGGYNYGFFLTGLDSTVLTQCDTEAIAKATGEARAVAYKWINPMNCNMTACYTEDVDGPLLEVSNANAVSIANTLVVDSLNLTPDAGFSSPQRLISIDSGGIGTLEVTFIGGDIRYAAAGTKNMLPPIVAGANAKVRLIGTISNPWDATGSGVVVTL